MSRENASYHGHPIIHLHVRGEWADVIYSADGQREARTVRTSEVRFTTKPNHNEQNHKPRGDQATG